MSQEATHSHSERSKASSARPSAGRKLAEWFTMGLSAALLAAVVGYLLYQTFQPDPRFVPITVTVLSQEVKTPAGQFIVPVEVKNLGARTAKDFKGAVSFRTPEGKTEQREFKLDYLGAGASQRVYLYLSEPPSEGQLEAKPLEYRLE